MDRSELAKQVLTKIEEAFSKKPEEFGGGIQIELPEPIDPGELADLILDYGMEDEIAYLMKKFNLSRDQAKQRCRQIFGDIAVKFERGELEFQQGSSNW